MVARTRVTLEGTVGGGGDTWTSSFHMGASTGYTLAQLQTVADTIDASWQSNVWTISSPGVLDYYAPATDYVRTTVRDIAASGLTARVVTAGPGSAILGTATSSSLPPECSIVVSLLSEVAGGRGRGRMYLPPTAVAPVGGLGEVSGGTVTDHLAAMQAFFNDLNASTDVPDDVSIYSIAADVLREVATIRIGNVYDAQRRRRNSLPEVYSGVPITH